jgi:hydrogenase maturation protein HypF
MPGPKDAPPRWQTGPAPQGERDTTIRAFDTSCERLRIRIRGTVRGVGFRPLPHGLATCHGASGFVFSDADDVRVEIEGLSMDVFLPASHRQHPPLVRIGGMDITGVPPRPQPALAIGASDGSASGHARIGPDAATCPACVHEFLDPSSRFQPSPFVTYTNCGARFTVTRRLPHDGVGTSMVEFLRHSDCARDCADTIGRRFHAETIASPACDLRPSHSMTEIATALHDGKIATLNGIGRFHLLRYASDGAKVQTLRQC